MGFKINNKGEKVAEGRSGFDPLPAGPYQVSIFNAEIDEFGPRSNNAGRPRLHLQFRIDDGQPGANRRLFANIGLFANWAANAKGEEKDNFTFFNFFAAVLGKKESDLRAEYRAAAEGKGDFEIPDAEELLGKQLTAVVRIVPDEYNYKKAVEQGTLEDGQTQADFKMNDIAAYRPAQDGGGSGTSSKDEGLIDL